MWDRQNGAVALSTQGLDAILGGHSHTLLQSIDPASTGGIPITQAGAGASDVSRLDLTFDLKQRKVVDTKYVVTAVQPNDTRIAPDPLTQQLVENVLAGNAPDTQKTVAQVKSTHDDHMEVATIAARAAMDRLQADAAIMDAATVWDSLRAGPVSPQNLFDCFKVEREPPGTPGFSSLYTVPISGASLRSLASQSRDGWVVLAPETIDDSHTYLLAGQKRTLNHPHPPYLPDGITLGGTPTAGVEVWDALTSYATRRQAVCAYLDVDEMVPGCTSR